MELCYEERIVVNGHGLRAARREKFLSRPSGSGKTRFAVFCESGAFLRRLDHHVERRKTRHELAHLDVWGVDEFEFCPEITVRPPRQFDWMAKKAQGCVCAHVTARRVYFS